MPYGSLVVKFSADLAELQKDVRRVTTIMQRDFSAAQKRIGNILGALGLGAGGGAFVGLIKSAVDAQDQIYKLSQRIGVGVEALSALKFAGELSDVSIEALGTSLAKFNKALAETKEGTGEAGVAFRALGISVTDANGDLRLTDAVFADVAEAFAGMEDGAGKTAIAMRLFGRAGAEMIPLLNQGAAGLQAAKDEALALGIVMDGTAAKAAEQFNDDMLRMQKYVKGVVQQITIGMLPVLDDLVNAFRGTTNESEKWREVGRDIGEVLKGVGVAAVYVIGFVESLGKTLGGLGAAAAAVLQGEFALAGRIVREIKADNDKLDVEVAKRAAMIKALGSTDLAAQRDINALGDIGGRATKRKAPGLPDEAAAKKALDERKKFEEAFSKLAESRAKAVAAEEKSLADERLKILQRFHEEGLLDEQDYWATRLEIQQRALSAEISAADQAIAEAQKALTAAEKGANTSVTGATDYLNALRNLEEAQAKRNDLERQFARLGVDNWLDSREAAMRYADAIRDVNVRLLELQGRSAEAAAITFDAANERLLKEAQRRKDPAAEAKIKELRAATLGQAEFNEATKRAELIQRQLGIEEERIRNSRESGAISEMRSLQATGEARARALVQLKAMADDLDRIAARSGDVFLRQEAEAFRVEVERLANQTDLLAQKFDQIGESAFSDFLTDIIDGTKSVSAAFKSMADSIVKQINRIAAEEIATRIFGGRGGGGGGMGFGSFMSGIFGGTGGGGFLSGLFGGGSSGLAIDAVLAAGGGGILPFANGGRFRAGQAMLVGEQGPELILPDTGGTVVPNGRFGGGMTVVNQFTISAPVDRRTQQQIAASAALGANRASRRNN